MTDTMVIEHTAHGYEVNRGTIRVIAPLATEAEARAALAEIDTMTAVEATVILGLADWPVPMAELRDLNSRDCVLVANTIGDLIERGLLETDGPDTWPTLTAEEIASENTARRERAAR